MRVEASQSTACLERGIDTERTGSAMQGDNHHMFTTQELRDNLSRKLRQSVPAVIADAFSDTVSERNLRFWFDLQNRFRQFDSTNFVKSDPDNLWAEQTAADSFSTIAADKSQFWAVYLNGFLTIYELTEERCDPSLVTSEVIRVSHPGFEAVELTGAPPKELILSGTIGLGSDWAGEILTCDSGIVRIITPQTEPESGELPSALNGSWTFQDDDSDGISEIRRVPNWKIKDIYYDPDGDGEFEFIRLPDSIAVEDAVSILVYSQSEGRFVLKRQELE